MIRIAIVEDEQEQVQLIRAYLTKYEQEKGVAFGVSVFDNGLKFLSNYHPIYDLVLMDIQMPHLNGYETARTLFSMDKNIGIVFVTNMAQYAIKGYEVDALDFIVKPLKYYQFSVKLGRVIEKIKKREDREIVLTIAKEKKRIPVSQIYYVEVDKHTLVYHTGNGVFRVNGSSMSECAVSLEDYGFALCNSGCLVNLKHVVSADSGTVRISNCSNEFVLSRGKKKEFTEKFMTYMRGR